MRKVQCNWCESIFYEEKITLDGETEHCPICKISGYLMDIRDNKKIYLEPSMLPPKRGFVLTGEKREPKKDEWYLSGAIPEAYQAFNDLSEKYLILRMVNIKYVPGHYELA
jgi:hypothetical protein